MHLSLFDRYKSSNILNSVWTFTNYVQERISTLQWLLWDFDRHVSQKYSLCMPHLENLNYPQNFWWQYFTAVARRAFKSGGSFKLSPIVVLTIFNSHLYRLPPKQQQSSFGKLWAWRDLLNLKSLTFECILDPYRQCYFLLNYPVRASFKSCIFEQIGSLWFWSNTSPFLLQKIASASPKEICIWQRAFGVKHCLKIIIIIPIVSFPFCKFVSFFAKKTQLLSSSPKESKWSSLILNWDAHPTSYIT